MALDAKDAQLQLLREQLQNAHATTPESLRDSSVPDYFHYNTGFTYDRFNDLCEFFKLPNKPDSPDTPIPLTYKKQPRKSLQCPCAASFYLH